MFRALVVVSVMLVTVGCTKTEVSKSDSTGQGGSESAEEHTVVEGPLVSSKAMFVGKYLVDTRFLDDKLGKDWRSKTESRRVRVEGTTVIYTCGPNAQCLTGGEIPRFKSVDKIEILAP